MNLSTAAAALTYLVSSAPTIRAACPFAGTTNAGLHGADAGHRLLHEAHRADGEGRAKSLTPTAAAPPVLGRFHKPPLSRRAEPQEERRNLQAVFLSSPYSNQREGDGATIPEGGYEAVRVDLTALLTNSQAPWPADFDAPEGPNYGGLFIRLAWHCNGSYRISDGRGGCDGGNIRFSPENVWPDNASLNFALDLLKPTKEKFGESLSWGDLIVLAGDTAIKSMGGPVIGFCGGRIDNSDGAESEPLGPSVIQQELMPCGDDICPEGMVCPGCQSPLGAAFMGLIYVNPEGPEGHKGDFEASAASIREVFGRMGFNDRATVATIGGGHAFGKCHGACPADQVDSETEMCPGGDTWEHKFTSGLELKWTTTPTTWSNQYFKNLFAYNWINTTSPAGALQWEPEGENMPPIGMLTTDLALAEGDSEYKKLSSEYAEDLGAITKDFGEGWYQLMSRDMGQRERCLGDELPEMQAWETSLGPLKASLPDYVPVRKMIQKSIGDDENNLSLFAQLAMQCSNTFRQTDYRGGCNGARIRFEPEISWESNDGASDALEKLKPIKDAHSDVSWADIIVLAGQTAIEAAGGNKMSFCGGRVDAENGDASVGLKPVIYNNNTDASTVYDMAQKGLSMEEGVALFATPADGAMELSNRYFKELKAAAEGSTTDGTMEGSNSQMYKNMGSMWGDQALLQETLTPIVDAFANDNTLFLETYAMAWNYMVTSDLFDGPTKNACEGVDTPTVEVEGDPSSTPTLSPTTSNTAAPTSAPSAASHVSFAAASFVSIAAVAILF